MREVKEIIARTPAELKGKVLAGGAVLQEVGYFQPSTANWIYKVYKINYDGFPIMVATKFERIQ
jgi:hypothetical protein